jgi:hypothetical protein
MKLSILIPSTVSRKEMTDILIDNLSNQILSNHLVEIISDWHPYNCVGKKRNDLLKKSQGEYIVFVDSDDLISINYVSSILKAIESKPDCVGINGIITFNGCHEKKWFISKEYGSWYEKNNIYYRTPNHISPVKRELALQAGFPEISFGEDAEYSRRLLPLLKTETIINEPIYHYRYVQK